MQSIFRTSTRLARPSPSTSLLTHTTRLSTRPYASQSYGGDGMSGHAKSDAPNPKAHLEHPGPESPASEASTSQSSTSQKDSSSSPSSNSSRPEEGSQQSYPSTSHGGSPAINNPGPAPEDANEKVRKHNEEVAKSHDRPVNQIDEDGKVDKGFWKDKVGEK